MTKLLLVTLLLLSFVFVTVSRVEPVAAHPPKGVLYRGFQFPPDKLPKIDGDPRDWEMVPQSYVIDGSKMMDTVMGKGKNMDPKFRHTRNLSNMVPRWCSIWLKH